MKINEQITSLITNDEDPGHTLDMVTYDHSAIIKILRDNLNSNPIQTIVQEYLTAGPIIQSLK